jgi:hypothetical protein
MPEKKLRDHMAPEAGKLYDSDDVIFDLTEFLKILKTQVEADGIKVDADVSVAVDNVGLKNTLDEQINPATEEKQDESIGLSGKTLHEDFGEAAVPPSTESTLASIIVPVGKKIRLRGVHAEGDDDGIFRIYVNAQKKWQARNAWTNRNVNFIIELEAVAGDTIYLKAYNPKGSVKNYSGSIYGYEIG